ncbi:helix-turn-helix domain-containing protein [Streptomyces sp. AN091965]|uniref:helix-turn-helix domain-containing protein n=1 Tax=Streptomyces sp. AN091965 TaxID=2927803 RepID=UPI001F608D68|nr:helix-turn-helix domain-containing protein [Streptomyces sp. AN091965]MCI3935409.1 helix-turn-helix domain-containing protein [Streptomyces sp. AN091965]
MDHERTPPGRGVLEGAFLLLEELARAGEAGPTGLSRATGLPKSTVHRLLDQLTALGAVERHAGGYRVGATVARLGRSWSAHRALERNAALPLRHLVSATRATVCLTVPHAGQMTVVTGIPAAAREFFPHLAGETLPPDSAADVIFAAAGPTAAPPPGHSTAQWTRRLRRAREQGADVHAYEWDGERNCLAVPVHAPSGAVVAALGVAVVDTRCLGTTVEAARRAARMLSTGLGRAPRPGTPHHG